MSQNPNYNPNYNPYGQNPPNPNNPNTPGNNPGYPGTAYGGPPAGPNQGYNPYPPNPPSGPNPPTPGPGANPNSGYGPYDPYSGAPTPPPPGPSTNPYDPYAPTMMSQGSNAGFTPYAPPPPSPPMMPPTPPRKGGLSGRTIGAAVAALLLIAAAIIISLVAYNNVQTSNANATSTALAHTQATGTALAHATATGAAIATATTIASTYPFSDKVSLKDPLADNTKGYGWQESTPCKFSGSAYHIIDSQANTYQPCVATNTNFTDFTFQVEATIKQGNTGAAAGLIFRADSANSKFYRIYADKEGNYGILVSVDTTGTNVRALKTGSSSAINTGLDQTNTLGIVARGSSISFYVNNQLVTTVTDPTYSHGQIGFSADVTTGTTDVVYSNAEVWAL